MLLLLVFYWICSLICAPRFFGVAWQTSRNTPTADWVGATHCSRSGPKTAAAAVQLHLLVLVPMPPETVLIARPNSICTLNPFLFPFSFFVHLCSFFLVEQLGIDLQNTVGWLFCGLTTEGQWSKCSRPHSFIALLFMQAAWDQVGLKCVLKKKTKKKWNKNEKRSVFVRWC